VLAVNLGNDADTVGAVDRSAGRRRPWRGGHPQARLDMLLVRDEATALADASRRRSPRHAPLTRSRTPRPADCRARVHSVVYVADERERRLGGRCARSDDARATKRLLVEEFGLLYEEMDGTRMAGRVSGWLLLCDPPAQSLTQIAVTLGREQGSGQHGGAHAAAGRGRGARQRARTEGTSTGLCPVRWTPSLCRC